MNNINLIGRLTKNPELKETQSGKAVTTFTIAVNRPYAKDEADFINIVTWNKVAENCGNYLKKGLLVGVSGRIQIRNYENKEGKKVYVTEVISNQVDFLEWGDKKGKKTDDDSDIDLDEFKSVDDNDDDIPF